MINNRALEKRKENKYTSSEKNGTIFLKKLFGLNMLA